MAQPLDSWGALTLAVAGGAACIFFLWRQWLEVRALRAVARSLWTGGRLADHGGLEALQGLLRARISFEGVSERRILLRQSAHRTLRSGRGHCGENARVAVLLLRLGGVPANRLYLHGARWGHVLAEHRWEGRWVLFDAHDDPRTVLPPDRLGAVPSESIASLPNGYPENPWLDFSRIQQLRFLPGGGRLSKLRVPTPLVVVAESPNLALALASVVISVGAILGWLLR